MIKVNDNGGDLVEINLDEADLHDLELKLRADITNLSGVLEMFTDDWDKIPFSARVKLGVWCSGGLRQLGILMRSLEERN